MRGAMLPDELDARPRCGRRGSPCRCRGAGRRRRAGPVAPPGPVSAAACGGGLEQVPVDGEAVVGVALRLVAHGRPLGEQPGEQALLVERLEGVDGGRSRPRTRTSAWRVSGGHGSGGGGHGRPGGGGPWRWAARARRPTAQPEGKRGVLATGASGVSATFAADLDQPAPARVGAPSLGAVARARRRRKRRLGGGVGLPQATAPPRVVAHPGDRAAGLGYGGHQVVGVGVAERAATWSCSWSSSLSSARPAVRWSSTRMSVRSAGAARARPDRRSRPARGAYTAMARSTLDVA